MYIPPPRNISGAFLCYNTQMLRVTSGSAKGKKLKAPDLAEYRGVQDVAKLAIFSILGERVIDAACLDLYAGSGSLGIEALSRGAKTCDFVDESRMAEVVLEENLRNTGFENRGGVFKQDSIKFVGNTEKTYDLVFADPYYKEIHFKFLFEQLEQILNEKGVIIFSHGKDTDIEEEISNTKTLEIYDQKRYGNAYITIMKKE